MKLKIIPTKNFIKETNSLLKKGQLLDEDYNSFLNELAHNPNKGDVISGTAGVRKIRLKSASKGKRGGLRVCYYFYVIENRIYLLSIYAKNEQENISIDEKKDLKEIVKLLKG